MSRPRQVVPGRTYLVTRRCRDRRFLLRPDDPTNQAFVYCLALAAQRCNVGVVAFVANSNHWHGVVIDRDGRLPEFLQMFHVMVAKHQNALRGRWENFWASEQTSVVHLVGLDDVVAKVGYALCNPVKDHLVERAQHWPGASAIFAMRDGGVIKAKRPRRFFDKGGGLPESVELRLCTPQGFDEARAWLRTVEDVVAKYESDAAADCRARGLRVMGRKAILRQHWDDRPTSAEPRRELSPRVACRNKWARIERLQQDKAWLETYQDARERFLAGERDVVFPPGTYWLRKHAGVTCDDSC